MKKILFIGIGEKNGPKQRMTFSLERNNVEYIYAKWSDLSFFGADLYINAELVDFSQIGAVFFDIPRFSIKLKNESDEKNEICYHLENELHALLSILKEKGVYAPNRDFFLKYPYYNKFSQAYIFNSKGVQSIKTLHFCDNKISKIAKMLELAQWNFPLVVKESYGARGSKVWKITEKSELEDFIKDKRNVNIVLQPYVENTADFRVIVVDGKCLGIMKRSAKNGEWKNNFSLGGDVSSHKEDEMEKFAVDVCNKMNLDIAGLDIFSTNLGYLVIEINLFFGLDGFEEVYKDLSVSDSILNLISKNMNKK